LFSGGTLTYDPASWPRLFSVGADGLAGTNDDIVF
jgi:hypothetical protein